MGDDPFGGVVTLVEDNAETLVEAAGGCAAGFDPGAVYGAFAGNPAIGALTGCLAGAGTAVIGGSNIFNPPQPPP